MSPKKKPAQPDPAVVRTLHMHDGKKVKGVVAMAIRPAMLVCTLENGKTVEVPELKVQQIDPPPTETIPTERA